ncbi:MAG: hypothetical protein ACLSAF_03470 [Intestinimonas sp.]
MMKMSFGNRIGFLVDPRLTSRPCLETHPGAIVAECGREIPGAFCWAIPPDEPIVHPEERLRLPLTSCCSVAKGAGGRCTPPAPADSGGVEAISCTEGRSPAVCAHKTARPKAVIPVFPGTNCEYDTAAACLRAGIEPRSWW